MSGPSPSNGNGPRRPDPGADDEFARAYADGYGEGLREAFREVLGHAARGHTVQELRMLIESRLARLREDVDLKRRSLTGPPRQPSWSALLRPPSPVPLAPPAARPAPGERLFPVLVPGESYLFREERPARASAFVAANAAAFPRVVVASFRPPDLAAVGPERLTVLRVGPGGGGPSSPTELSGRLRAAMEGPGGALVYLDVFEMMATEHGVDPMLRFVAWATQSAQSTGSTVVLSVDPKGVDDRTMSLLKRSFAGLV